MDDVRSRSQVGFDLLALRGARSLVAWPGFPVVFQAGALAAVVALVAVGLGVGPGLSAGQLLTLRKTNLTTLVVWGLWWPGMIAVAIAFGRAWCTVCPMELVSRAGDAVARRLAWPRLRLGRLLRAGWVVVALYLALQLLVAGLSIHRVPHYTAILLLALGGVALVTGLVFRAPRSFCRCFCPAGALLSVYGRLTPVQLEMRDPSLCKRCPTKDCVRAQNRHRLDGRSCPSLLRPFDRQAADGCVTCFQCAKVCPHGNVGYGLVSAAAPIRRKALLRPSEAAFVMVALGFVFHELAGEVSWVDDAFHAVPRGLAQIAPSVPLGWAEALWFLMLFPLVVWAAIAVLGRVAGCRGGLGPLLLAAATGAAPVVAVAHLAKAVAKLTSWGVYLPLALRDPHGLDTLSQVADGSLAAPAALLGLTAVGAASLALIPIAAWWALRRAWLMPAASIAAARVGSAAAAALFSAALAAWTWPVP